VPCYEVPRTDPSSADEPGFGALADTVFDMRTLSLASDADLPGMLAPLVAGYREWLADQGARLGTEPDLHEQAQAATAPRPRRWPRRITHATEPGGRSSWRSYCSTCPP
jgi:hypothetical protein